MKLTIDTAADTKEHIREAIKLLMNLVAGEKPVYTNEEPQTPAFDTSVSNLMSMFDTKEQPKQELPKTESDVPELEFY